MPALVRLVVFAVVTVLVTAVLAATIGNLRFTPTRRYLAVFSDATGVLAGDDVRVAGVRVGEVTSVRVRDRSLAELGFTVDDDRPIYGGTRAVIRYRNLVGQRYLALVDGPGDPSPLGAGATIPLSRTQPALDLNVLLNGFKPLFAALSPDQVNQLAFEIVRTLQGEGGTVNGLLLHTAELTSALADRDQVIGDLLDQLDALLATVDQRDRQLSELIVELERLVSGLAKDRSAIGASLVGINGLAAATAGLLDRGRAPIKRDLVELDDLSRTLNANQGTVEGFLRRLPGKLDTITRTATYGSWFNFYLCDFDGKVVIPQVASAFTPDYHLAAARCP